MTTDKAGPRSPLGGGAGSSSQSLFGSLRERLHRAFGKRNGESSIRDALEELIEEHQDSEVPISADERLLIQNVLKLRDMTAFDVMVPRAEIVAIEVSASQEELVALMSREAHSRVPVYRETLDDVIGFVHIKDVLARSVSGDPFDLPAITRKALFVSPTVRVLDLLLQMRLARVHMAMVVDEFGGVDGVVTIEDLVEEIVGDIQDEHDVDEVVMIERPDGSLVADARTELEEFEERVGPILTEEERAEDIDTLGGLVVALADRVPSRGEVLVHSSGIEFEVIDADPRRVKRLRVRKLPPRSEPDADA